MNHHQRMKKKRTTKKKEKKNSLFPQESILPSLESPSSSSNDSFARLIGVAPYFLSPYHAPISAPQLQLSIPFPWATCTSQGARLLEGGHCRTHVRLMASRRSCQHNKQIDKRKKRYKWTKEGDLKGGDWQARAIVCEGTPRAAAASLKGVRCPSLSLTLFVTPPMPLHHRIH